MVPSVSQKLSYGSNGQGIVHWSSGRKTPIYRGYPY